MESTTQALENARLELLDMGLRGNSLLHFRAGAKTVEVVDERTEEILRLLVEERRSLSFAPLPAKLANDPKPLEMPELIAKLAELQGEKRHQDSRLQTRLTAEQLDKRLLKIHTDALTFIQEQGVNTLYLALGFLTWSEVNSPETPRKAPLLLVPVSLTRTSARERFALRYTEAELGRNLTLAAKLKMEFQIELPEFAEDTLLTEYWEALRHQVAGKKGWSVEPDEIALGFFSFGKFQMYQDLAPEIWPEDKKPAAHPTLHALLRSGFTPATATSPAQTAELGTLNFVKDADSSQAAAVLAVRAGGHLVIQGPPGTGKSQTITNIIADSLADGKTVLFVAEKMAALDVVKRRLEETHLGAAVLALHSHKTNKRSVLEDLQTTLELGAPVVGDHTEDLQRHRQRQVQLDRYCEAVNTPILHSNLSFIDALGLYHQASRDLGDVAQPALDTSAWLHWSATEFQQLDRSLAELAAHVTVMGVPAQHPFAGAGLQECSPVEIEALRACLAGINPQLAKLAADATELAGALDATSPQTLEELEALLTGAELLARQPALNGLNTSAPEWHTQRGLLQELLNGREERFAIQRRRAVELLDQAWQIDMLETRRIWATLGGRWWRVFASDFRRARRTLQGILKAPMPPDASSCIALLDDILRVQALQQTEARHAELTGRLCGPRWEAEGDLQRESEWLMALHEQPRQVTDAVLHHSAKGGSFAIDVPRLEQMRSTLAALDIGLKQLAQLLVLHEDPRKQPLDALQRRCASQPQQLERLYEMARYNRLRATLDQYGLEPILAQAYQGNIEPGQMQNHLRLNWYRALLTHVYAQSEPLRFFDRQAHEGAIHEFRKLDVALFRQTQERLVAQHFQQLPNGGAGEMEILRREMNKKRRHLPIRQLLAQAGRAVQKIKPVFMMSPMSVATYLQPGDLEFDVVIFDEASQVRVVDAFGPLLRARQAVVVGDTRQMPPTDFFNKSLELDEEEAESSATADIESILSMFLTKGAPETWLRWHYRSRHESLIAVSNREFYDSKLFIFPSPGLNPQARGLLFHHLPETVYERGTSRTNPGEARTVAQAVMRHARETPNLTLGVVAFSTAQRDCILQELELQRQEDTACEAFFDENQLEGFFVKNLENVQGDERDVIMISIGYGRTAEGNLSRNFGPLNSDGGQRRLNVLITRARLAMEVFCNFTAGDLSVTTDTPAGVAALREFLHYAAHREQAAQESGSTAAGHFEEVVENLLETEGYKVRSQVGAAGFYLDIALADPQRAGCYRLAVECDGANYQRNSNTRDRDRLRQQVLEGLGWDFYRIWSVDWYRQPQQEARRLLDRVAQAMSTATSPVEASPGETSPRETFPPATPVAAKPKATGIERSEARTPATGGAAPYRVFDGKLGITANTDLTRLSDTKVAVALQKILNCEGAVHLRETARRIADAAGGARVTSRLLEQISAAAQEGHRQGLFYLQGEFLYPDSTRQVMLRDRAELPASSRQWDLIPPEEWQAAVFHIVENAFSVSREDLVSHALTLLGFTRPSAQIKQQLNNTVQQLIEQQTLKEQSGRVTRA